jgi:hypothetical protein
MTIHDKLKLKAVAILPMTKSKVDIRMARLRPTMSARLEFAQDPTIYPRRLAVIGIDACEGAMWSTLLKTGSPKATFVMSKNARR